MKLRLILLLLILTAISSGAAIAAGPGPASQRWAVRPLAEIDLAVTDALDRASLAAEDEMRAAEGLPWRFALPEDVQLTPRNAGTWEDLPDGRRLWRLRVSGPGALSLNLGFTRFFLPDGARMSIYSPADPAAAQVYDAADNESHGELWTPVVIDDELVVEVEIEPADRPDLVLELSRINRGYRLFGEPTGEKSGLCNVNVVCEEGDDWRDHIDTVAMISIGGFEKCTGFMVNNTALDARPLFMTAAHCLLNEDNDQTLVVYWNFQSPTCDERGGGTKLDAQSGATWLATTQNSDFTLVELEEDPDPAWNVKFAGWNRSTADPTSAVAIHHPSTDEKSISFENDPLITTSYYGNTAPGDGTHLRVADWDLGTTEGGSSGSPLFDQDGYVVGELHGGDAACGNNRPDWYGRFSYAWDEGSTDSTRLSNWLDPLGTAPVTLGLFDPQGASYTVAPAEGFESEGIEGHGFSPESFTYTLGNTGNAAAAFVIEASVDWVAAEPPSGTIPPRGSVPVTVSLTAAAGSLGVGFHTGLVTFVNPVGSNGDVTRPVSLTIRANTSSLGRVVPNPFIEYTEVEFTMATEGPARARIYDLRGRLVRDLGTQQFSAGENLWPWDGDDGAGRRMPAGMYVFELSALGQTHRVGITLLN